jgi:hypothetical protein
MHGVGLGGGVGVGVENGEGLEMGAVGSATVSHGVGRLVGPGTFSSGSLAPESTGSVGSFGRGLEATSKETIIVAAVIKKGSVDTIELSTGGAQGDIDVLSSCQVRASERGSGGRAIFRRRQSPRVRLPVSVDAGKAAMLRLALKANRGDGLSSFRNHLGGDVRVDLDGVVDENKGDVADQQAGFNTKKKDGLLLVPVKRKSKKIEIEKNRLMFPWCQALNITRPLDGREVDV